MIHEKIEIQLKYSELKSKKPQIYILISWIIHRRLIWGERGRLF